MRHSSANAFLSSIATPLVFVGALLAPSVCAAKPAAARVHAPAKHVQKQDVQAEMRALALQLALTKAELHKVKAESNQRAVQLAAKINGRLDSANVQVTKLSEKIAELKKQNSKQGS